MAQSTLNRQMKDGALPLETAVGAARVLDVPVAWLLTGEAGSGQEEAREWADDMLNVVRYVQGEHPMDEAERRRVQIDILKGMIRLGRDEGRDVGKLVALRDELAQLGAPPPLTGPLTAERLLVIWDRDSQAALVRAEAGKELAMAQRLAEEEALLRARRVAPSSSQEIQERMERARQMVDVVSRMPPLSTGEDPPPPPGPPPPHAR